MSASRVPTITGGSRDTLGSQTSSHWLFTTPGFLLKQVFSYMLRSARREGWVSKGRCYRALSSVPLPKYPLIPKDFSQEKVGVKCTFSWNLSNAVAMSHVWLLKFKLLKCNTIKNSVARTHISPFKCSIAHASLYIAFPWSQKIYGPRSFKLYSDGGAYMPLPGVRSFCQNSIRGGISLKSLISF